MTAQAARHLASSGVDVYTAIAGAVGALYGPLHGGANEAVLRMLERIGTTDNIPQFLEGVKHRKEKMFGFGHRCPAFPTGQPSRVLISLEVRLSDVLAIPHRKECCRVYKNFDPRAKVIRQVAEEVFEIQGRDPLIDVAIALEKAARADEYFVERKLYPNVDFYSGERAPLRVRGSIQHARGGDTSPHC